MKIKVQTKALKEALARVATIPGANTTSIHTQAVKLVGDMAGLSFVRFTSEAKIVVTIDESVEVMEALDNPSVNHAALTSLVNACKAMDTLLYTDDKNLYLVSGRSKWKLKVFDKDILIDPPEPELETEHCNMLLEDITELFAFAAPAASRDSAGSAAFCGVNVAGREGGLSFTATDSRRCYIAVAPYDLKVNATIPNEGVSAILKAIAGTKGAATFSIGETFVTVSSSNLEISTGLLADLYPNAAANLVTHSLSSIKSKVRVNRDELISALEACASVNETERIVNFKVEKDMKTLEITGSNTRDAGGGSDMDCTASMAVHVGVPGSDMAAIFKKLKTDEGMIEMLFTDRATFVKQPERIAFFALAQPRKMD